MLHSYPLRLLLWPAALLMLPALAQHPGRSGLGLKIGAQMANQRSAGYHFDPVPGALAGVYAPLSCGNRFEIQPELLASLQGASIPSSDGDPIVLHTLYAQLPINMKLFLSNAINLQGGGYMARLLMASSDGENVTANMTPWDAGVTGGLGVDMITGFDLTLRYVYGLSNTYKDDHSIFPTTRCIQLTAGWRVKQFRHHLARRRK